MVNIAGYRVGETDMATFGSTYLPAIAEDENGSPWEPLSVDRGFKAGSNVVTVLSALSQSWPFISLGPAEDTSVS